MSVRPDEARVQEIGRELFERVAAERQAFYSADRWTAALFAWSLQHEDAKLQLFRFVDVLPALDSDRDLVRHLREYFEGREVPYAGLLRAALGVARVAGRLGDAVVGAMLRETVRRLARRFIAGGTPAQAPPGAPAERGHPPRLGRAPAAPARAEDRPGGGGRAGVAQQPEPRHRAPGLPKGRRGRREAAHRVGAPARHAGERAPREGRLLGLRDGVRRARALAGARLRDEAGDRRLLRAAHAPVPRARGGHRSRRREPQHPPDRPRPGRPRGARPAAGRAGIPGALRHGPAARARADGARRARAHLHAVRRADPGYGVPRAPAARAHVQRAVPAARLRRARIARGAAGRSGAHPRRAAAQGHSRFRERAVRRLHPRGRARRLRRRAGRGAPAAGRPLPAGDRRPARADDRTPGLRQPVARRRGRGARGGRRRRRGRPRGGRGGPRVRRLARRRRRGARRGAGTRGGGAARTPVHAGGVDRVRGGQALGRGRRRRRRGDRLRRVLPRPGPGAAAAAHARPAPRRGQPLHARGAGRGRRDRPWNFPLAILTGMTSAALATGNTVVMKPAEQTPVIAAQLMEVFEAAGLPPGVVNYAPGRGEVAGDRLVRHPDVSLIAFTGSQEVGTRIYATAAATPGSRMLKRVVAEMGGKNAIIVDDDADLDEAVQGILTSAFGYAGQKCSACSRVIGVGRVYPRLVERLAEAARTLPMGPADAPGTIVGPVIDEASRERILSYIDLGKRLARPVLLREPDRALDALGGYYVAPAIFADVPLTCALAREEIFGPVLSEERRVGKECRSRWRADRQ